jgi:moderate conductance mechanosensitive channel
VAALRATAVGLALLLGLIAASLAQTPSAPPQPLPKEQFDALVEAVKKAVADELRAQGSSATAAPANKPAGTDPAATSSAPSPGLFGTFGRELTAVIAAMPQARASLQALPRALDESSTGGRSTANFLSTLLATMVAALAVEAILRAVLVRLKMRLATNAGPGKGMRSLAYLGLLALLDGIPVLGLWLASHFAAVTTFTGDGLQAHFAHSAMATLLVWRVYALVLRLIVRPDVPAARLCEIDDKAAGHFYRSVVGILLLFIFFRFLALQEAAISNASDSAIAASRLFTSPIALAALIWLVIASKTPIQQWLGGLGRAARFAGFIGRHWVGVAVTFVVALVATQVYGAITGHRNVPTALLLTLNLVATLLLFETLLQAFVRRLDSQLEGYTPASTMPTLADVVARCIRVAVLIGVIVLMCESWVVNVLGLVDPNAWDRLTGESRTAGITLFVAYMLWEAFKYGTDSYLRRHADDASSTATRLGTLIPLLRVTVAIMLTVVALLIALENIGVNVTPLLAGASVLGLALSFGSQTLVRDIVSGIFYLTDDAFRAGEFIDCEKAKGTVEGFTLRSVRLRNQSGQLHTVPFGELGRVTNFSRDWAAVEFNLRFARDTDLDKLRQATAKVSDDIMEVPELKQALLEPLKMDGIADVGDNALVIRFKFVTRPGTPGTVQHEAMSRMLTTFPQLGIAFAK